MSGTLLEPGVEEMLPSTDGRDGWDVPAPTTGGRRTAGSRVVAGLAAVAVAVGSTLAVPPIELAQAGPVGFDGDATHLTIERFDDRGVYALRYVHGADAEIRIPVRNDGWLTTTLTGVSFDGRPAPMIDPVGARGTPVELAPGEAAELVVYVRFDNCEYYTERAMDVYDDVTVTSRTAGIDTSSTVTLDHALVVRSPMMTTCPDRVSDRDAFIRGG